MTKIQCRKLVYEFAERIGVDHPFNKDSRMAGEDWLYNFMNEFSFRDRQAETPQSTQGSVCSQDDTEHFFRTLFRLRKSHGFLPEKIYHADEIFISAVTNDLTRFISSTGSERMLVETRDNITLVCCASAVGSYIPPMIVFPRDKMIPGFLRGLPPGSIGYTSERGLVNSELFLTFLKHFVQHALPSSPSPALLLIDNYISYVSIEAMDFCAENNVAIMGFPPHSRQKLQPLGISFFGPLKACYSQGCDGFNEAFPRVKLTVDNVGEVFRTAYCRTATTGNAVKGFIESGIEPFKPQIFSPDSIIPVDLTMTDSSQESENISAAADFDIETVSWNEPFVDVDSTSVVTSESQEKYDMLKGTVEGDGEGIACLQCGGLFLLKEWVQCFGCRQWWHFECSGYDKGVHCEQCR